MSKTVNMGKGISIQVGLSGYSFKVKSGDYEKSSGWTGVDHIFTTKEFQSTYDYVELSVFTHKCTLVPAQFHSPELSESMLSDAVALSAGDKVDFIDIPHYGAVLLYSNSIGETLSKVISQTVCRNDGDRAIPLPEQYFMLRELPALDDYNKIMASYMDGYLYLAIAQGRTLMLCNSFEAQDFTTAEYFLFLTMKKLQLNPEMSTIYFRTPLTHEQEMSLYRYFRSVEQL